MEKYILFLFFKSIIKSIDSRFATTFNDMVITKPYSVGCYIKAPGEPRYRVIATGGYCGFTSRVQLVMNAGRGTDDLLSLLALSSKLMDTMSKLSNSVYPIEGYYLTDEGIVSKEGGTPIALLVTKTELYSDTDFKGTTAQDIPRYVSNYLVEFSILPYEGGQVDGKE